MIPRLDRSPWITPRPVWGGLSLAIAFAIAIAVAATPALAADPPNMVIILADDLGYGDLSCYGSESNHTPAIDRLAREGIRFTDFHSNGPMCSPTRAALLTGLYQHRFGRRFESALSGRAGRGDRDGLPLSAVTMPEVLKKQGYATALFGKWHLGYEPPFLPTRHGFDEFRGLLTGDGDHHTHIDRSGYEDWWHGESVAMETGYTADLLTNHSVDLIRQHKTGPFFLLLSHLAIHFPWQAPDDPPQRTVGRSWHDDKWGILPDRSNIAPHVKGMIESLDRSVGRVMAALDENGLAEKTLLIFLSDNGGYLSYDGGFENISSNGPLRGQKAELWEGGHRVPAIAWWPGRIKPRVCDDTLMTFDLFPTLLTLAGAEVPATDGIDLAPLLLAQEPTGERLLCWRMRDERAVRRGKWKLLQRGSEQALFDLHSDLGERMDRSAQHPALVQDLEAALKQWEKDVARQQRQ